LIPCLSCGAAERPPEGRIRRGPAESQGLDGVERAVFLVLEADNNDMYFKPTTPGPVDIHHVAPEICIDIHTDWPESLRRSGIRLRGSGEHL
jgi:hypothetical protein